MQQRFDTKQTYIIVNKKYNLALEAPIQSNYNNESLGFGPINQNNPKQLWIVQYKDKNRYQLIFGFPDIVLTANGHNVTLKRGVGDKKHQYWILDQRDPTLVLIRQAKEEKNMLSVSDHKVILKNGYIDDSVGWQFRSVSKNNELNRCCYISCMRTSKLMDVPASEENEGVKICIWDANHRFNQRWKIYRAGEVFIIKSFKTDLNLDIEGENYKDGEDIIQWHSTGGNNQFWTFQKKGVSAYRIASWLHPQLEIGHNGKTLSLNHGNKFTWKIDGYFPEL